MINVIQGFEASDRVFQLWSYSVSMRRLLLRSTKSESFDSRIDLAFQNVHALKLPAQMHGLSVKCASQTEIEEIVRDIGLSPDEKWQFYLVSGSLFSGYVVAGAMISSEDNGEYNEPSVAWPKFPETHL
jgi:hypothetical protein